MIADKSLCGGRSPLNHNGTPGTPLAEGVALKMDKLQICIGALRVLARRQNDPNAQMLAEREVNEFLRQDNAPLAASVERIVKAIDAEADKNIPGEEWDPMRAYVQWCREELAASKD